MRSKLVTFISLLAVTQSAVAFQYDTLSESTVGKHEVSVSTGLAVSYRQQLPFWLVANNSARFSATEYLGAFTQVQLKKRPGSAEIIDYFYGLETVAFAGSQNTIKPIQAYGGVKFRDFLFTIGKREELFGVNDSTLSIGNLVYGNNASPIPKVSLSTKSWVRTPIFGNVFSFRAYIAHGWFEADRQQSNALLHQKYLLIKSQFLKKKLSLIAGINHSAQWGGKDLISETSQPTGLVSFARIFSASQGGVEATNSDQKNALGNHLGSYDLSAQYEFNNFTIQNYWQFLWEDKSGLTPYNWQDGLVGLSVKTRKEDSFLRGFNLEIIRTNGQDAQKTDENGNSFVEPDNFFNNGTYQSGWTYHNRVIGNPIFLLVNPESRSNNRVKNMINGLNVGLEGTIEQVSYKLNYRSFQNQGTFHERFNPVLNLKAIILSLSTQVFGGHLDVRSSFEWGNYPYKSKTGILLSYTHTLSFR